MAVVIVIVKTKDGSLGCCLPYTVHMHSGSDGIELLTFQAPSCTTVLLSATMPSEIAHCVESRLDASEDGGKSSRLTSQFGCVGQQTNSESWEGAVLNQGLDEIAEFTVGGIVANSRDLDSAKLRARNKMPRSPCDCLAIHSRRRINWRTSRMRNWGLKQIEERNNNDKHNNKYDDKYLYICIILITTTITTMHRRSEERKSEQLHSSSEAEASTSGAIPDQSGPLGTYGISRWCTLLRPSLSTFGRSHAARGPDPATE